MEDVDTFLKHYGVMGMHWGSRKTVDFTSKHYEKDQSIKEARKIDRSSDLAKTRTSSEKKKLAKNVALAVAIPVAVVGGYFLAKHMTKSYKSILRNRRYMTDPKNQAFIQKMQAERLISALKESARLKAERDFWDANPQFAGKSWDQVYRRPGS